jgi:tetratricopeptide (TPR) repeat protein
MSMVPGGARAELFGRSFSFIIFAMEVGMRTFLIAVGLSLAMSSAVFADAMSDCRAPFETMAAVDHVIKACTLIIDGRAKGDKTFAFFRRGFAYSHNWIFDRAIADLNEAIRLNPQDATAYQIRALTYQNKYSKSNNPDDNERANADLRKAESLGAKP